MVEIDLAMGANPSSATGPRCDKLLGFSAFAGLPVKQESQALSPEVLGLNQGAHENDRRPRLTMACNKHGQNLSPRCVRRRPTRAGLCMKHKNKFLSSRILHPRRESDEIMCAKSLEKEPNPPHISNPEGPGCDLSVRLLAFLNWLLGGAGEGGGEQAAWGGVGGNTASF